MNSNLRIILLVGCGIGVALALMGIAIFKLAGGI